MPALPKPRAVILRSTQVSATVPLGFGKLLSSSGQTFYSVDYGLQSLFHLDEGGITRALSGAAALATLIVTLFTRISSIWQKSHPSNWKALVENFYKNKNSKQIRAGIGITINGAFSASCAGLAAALGSSRLAEVADDIATEYHEQGVDHFLHNRALHVLVPLLVGVASFISFLFYNIIDHAVSYAHRLYEDERRKVVPFLYSKLPKSWRDPFYRNAVFVFLNGALSSYFFTSHALRRFLGAGDETPLSIKLVALFLVLPSTITTLFTRIPKLLEEKTSSSMKRLYFLLPMLYIAHFEALSSAFGSFVYGCDFESDHFGAKFKIKPYWFLPLVALALIYPILSFFAERSARYAFTGAQAVEQAPLVSAARFFSRWYQKRKTNGYVEIGKEEEVTNNGDAEHGDVAVTAP